MPQQTSEQAIDQLAAENIEAFNNGDWNRLKASLASDIVYLDVPSKRRLQDIQKFVEEYQNWKSAGPNCKGTIKNTVVSGNKVTIEVNWKGTQTGQLGNYAPTGKSWDVDGCQVITIANGKVKELHQYYDMLSILQQLGLAGK